MFLFQAFQAWKVCFTIFQKETTPFQAIKTRSSKTRKINSFPKGLTHGFGPKMAVFPTFFLRHYGPGKCVLRYSRRQKRLSRLSKEEVKKVEKLRFFQRGQSMVLVQNWSFLNVFYFRRNRRGKCVLRFCRRKKRPFQAIKTRS